MAQLLVSASDSRLQDMRGSQLEGGEGLSTKVQNSSEISAGLTLDQVRRGGRVQGRSDDPEVVAPGPGRTAVRFIRQKYNQEKAAEHKRRRAQELGLAAIGISFPIYFWVKEP